MIDLEKLQRDWRANDDDGIMDSDVWNTVPALIRELRAAREENDKLRLRAGMRELSQLTEEFGGYEAEAKGET